MEWVSQINIEISEDNSEYVEDATEHFTKKYFTEKYPEFNLELEFERGRMFPAVVLTTGGFRMGETDYVDVLQYKNMKDVVQYYIDSFDTPQLQELYRKKKLKEKLENFLGDE